MTKRCSCGRVHEPGLLVQLVGGPRDGEWHDYGLGDPPGYVIDRRWGEDRGKKREYVYRWAPAPEKAEL